MDISVLPELGGFIWTIMSFIVALSVIVAIHEYGHYIVGRWCGIGADVFSIGFGPVLYSRVDKRGTKWQIAAYPLGGYVKFAGDANAASMGEDGNSALSQEEYERTMHGAKLYKRALTVLAGPVFNFILSTIIFAGFIFVNGEIETKARVGDLKELPPEIVTLQSGDVILEMADTEIEDRAGLMFASRDLPVSQMVKYKIERDGTVMDVEAHWPMLAIVENLQPRSAAISSGLEIGDLIRKVDGIEVYGFEQLKQIVSASDGRTLALEVSRKTEQNEWETINLSLTPKRADLPLPEGGFETRWLLGITGGLFFDSFKQDVGVFAAIEFGVKQVYYIISKSLEALWAIITGAISTCNLSGPVGIAQTSGDTASLGAGQFLWFIGVLSTAVGMLNLFPVPMLDGGHLVFYAYEGVARKKPNPKVVNILMLIGLSLMGMLMIFGLSQDLLC